MGGQRQRSQSKPISEFQVGKGCLSNVWKSFVASWSHKTYCIELRLKKGFEFILNSLRILSRVGRASKYQYYIMFCYSLDFSFSQNGRMGGGK